ncbi:MAG TPA: FAD/NAD(P)-binding oxidoreductase [Ramlibacter sp.]|uniref:NAD(P)/FAD-dependent oxidoreductase n=1 Tax=Ramlibacter sp. TaxID=1917967 RepID=UPI002BFFC1A9|nr:FAD/NAD(P)-binding oxidoreductase [Ramlibacter sp.]HVZ46615.1 FAD/NAD(P)-binding oxidoreductase [Ramlibacter sp.]
MIGKRPLVIVGASYAGLQIAASARENGFEEKIYLLGEEPYAPYHRPPLSKGLLTGKTREEQMILKSPDFFEQQGIELLTRTTATAFDAAQRRLSLADGSQLDYGWLALATGASPCRLEMPGANLDDVFHLRTLDDARAIATAAETATRVCVIGGGYIGLEVAAALASRRKFVTVLQRAPRLLSRSMCQVMSAYVEEAHRERGVDVRTCQRVRCFRPHLGRVAAVETEDGTQIHCDMVVLGLGVRPNSGLAAHAGLHVSDGIEVEVNGRTSAPWVVAAGDVACAPNPYAGHGARRVRLESIHAANEGAKAAAATIAGRTATAAQVPWFWSDQFDLKFQMAGIAQPGDEYVVRGEMASDRFSVAYLRDGVFVALHSVNRPLEHMIARKLVAARVRPNPLVLGDPSFDLQELLRHPVAAERQ